MKMIFVTLALKTTVELMQDLNTIVMDQVKMDYINFVTQSIMLENATQNWTKIQHVNNSYVKEVLATHAIIISVQLTKLSKVNVKVEDKVDFTNSVMPDQAQLIVLVI